MLGFNGGLMGVRKVPTTGAASGLWAPNEQSVAKRAGIWPQVFNGPQDLSPILWYDFADEATVTTSGTNLTQITDKGSRGATLTSTATRPLYVTGINGKKCVDWGNAPHSNALFNTSSTSISIAEAYVILDASFGSTFPEFNGLFGSYTEGMNITGRSTLAGFYVFSSFNNAFINNGAETFSSVLPAINSPSLLRIKVDGNSAVTTTTGFQIGMDRQNSGRGWYGLIGEMIFFSAVLGSTDRNSLQSWLANKWGITLV